MTRLVWFRSDLRCHDNPALWHACQQPDDVIAVAYITEYQWQQHGFGPRKIQLLKNRIRQLHDELQALNIPLLILTANTFASCNRSLQRLCVQLDVRAVSFNIEYEVNERQRDREFVHWCRDNHIDVNRFHDQCLLAPGKVLTRQQQPFRVFTPFKRAWLLLAQTQLQAPLPSPAPRNEKSEQALAHLADLQTGSPLPEIIPDPLWPVAEDAAHGKLERFIAQQLTGYRDQRDLPALDATSRLSFELSLGILSPRQCLYAAASHNHGRLSDGSAGADSWINELIWREFYRHLLVAFPQLCKHKAFKAETETIRWRQDDTAFQAWCEGRTGYPIVDAAMLQLRQEGWMHNRLRMVTAMFLTKHLLIDWRRGEAFFNQWLVDADLASNNGGWQWSASTGADAAPYFRIFNPLSQSEKFDAGGEFIARMLPEFAAIPARDRHNPDPQQRAGCHYPPPVVEHKAARLRALAAFKIIQPDP